MESLIEKGLMIGFGCRTSEKWFIEEVKLTSKGKKQIKSLYGRQQVLPFKLKRVIGRHVSPVRNK